MENHLIAFPDHFRYLHQYPGGRASSTPPQDRSLSAVLAMAAQIAAPGRWIPEELEAQLYAVLNEATAESSASTTQQQLTAALSWLKSQQLPYVDILSLPSMFIAPSNNEGEAAASTLDPERIRQTVERMNTLNIPQIVVIADESALKAVDGRTLHSWIDGTTTLPGSHALLRVGYSVGNGAGLYFDPASPGFTQPLGISWRESLLAGGVLACIALMPAGVPQPPSDHDWLAQDWPAKIAKPDYAVVQQSIALIQAEVEAHDATVKSSLAAMLAEVSKVTEGNQR